MKTTLLPLFDSLKHLHKNTGNAVLPDLSFRNDFIYALKFIQSYTGSLGTFNSYRRETERLLQWSWLIKKCSITELKREDIEQFIHFCQNPPTNWINTKKFHVILIKTA